MIGDWPVPDYTQYIAQRVMERGGLTLSAPVDAPSFGRLFTPYALVDVVCLDRQRSSLPPYRLDALRRSVVAMDIVFREEGEWCNFVNNNIS